jgi:hypothetical protein
MMPSLVLVTTTSPTSSTSGDRYFDYIGYWNIKTVAMRLLPQQRLLSNPVTILRPNRETLT